MSTASEPASLHAKLPPSPPPLCALLPLRDLCESARRDTGHISCLHVYACVCMCLCTYSHVYMCTCKSPHCGAFGTAQAAVARRRSASSSSPVVQNQDLVLMHMYAQTQTQTCSNKAWQRFPERLTPSGYALDDATGSMQACMHVSHNID
jgi:hypothetical protein